MHGNAAAEAAEADVSQEDHQEDQEAPEEQEEPAEDEDRDHVGVGLEFELATTASTHGSTIGKRVQGSPGSDGSRMHSSMVTMGETGVGVHGVVFVDIEISEFLGGCNRRAITLHHYSFTSILDIV